MLENQRDLFALDPSVTYLNGAYMAAQLKEVTQVGIDQLTKKSKPNQIVGDDFFKPRKKLKQRFASLIGAEDFNSIAIIPSVSYGVASVAKNINIEEGDEIVMCGAQFPSHVYAWQELARKNGGIVVMVDAPPIGEGRAKVWNKNLLEAISEKTKVVAIPNVHWTDGTLFDLVSIRNKSSEVGAKLIIDGTQSVGALPFSIQEIQPDALICAGYKWLMGPYGLGVAYYNESFWDGEPIEHNWINRYKSEDFANLTQYQDNYQPGADRFSVGESSNFIMAPMLTKAIEQTIRWGANNIQDYCGKLTYEGIEVLRSKGCFIESAGERSNHLFGVYLPQNMNKDAIKLRLQNKGIFVSYRDAAIRVSPHVYNSKEDFNKFVECVY